MATATAVFSDNVSVIAAQTLARGSTLRGTTSLLTKYGAFLFVKIGRGGTAVLSAGVTVRARRVLNNDTATAGGVHPASVGQLRGSTVAASSTTCATTDSTLGTPTLNVALITGFAAGDIICIQDSSGGVTRLEWAVVAKTATGVLTLDRNLQFTHTAAGADTVRNQSDAFPVMWLPGGSLWEVIFDYAGQTTGDTITVHAAAQTWDSESIV